MHVVIYVLKNVFQFAMNPLNWQLIKCNRLFFPIFFAYGQCMDGCKNNINSLKLNHFYYEPFPFSRTQVKRNDKHNDDKHATTIFLL